MATEQIIRDRLAWQIGQTITHLQGIIAIEPEPGRITVSRPLCEAIGELAAETTKDAPDWHLVAALSGVKSYITGTPNSDYHFWEDCGPDADESCYGILDGVHFEAARAAGVLPSGLSVFTAHPDGGLQTHHGHVDTEVSATSPTLRRIAAEEKSCDERARQFAAKWAREVAPNV